MGSSPPAVSRKWNKTHKDQMRCIQLIVQIWMYLFLGGNSYRLCVKLWFQYLKIRIIFQKALCSIILKADRIVSNNTFSFVYWSGQNFSSFLTVPSWNEWCLQIFKHSFHSHKFFLKKTFFRLCFGFVRTFAFSLLLIRILLRNFEWVGACVSVSFQTKKTLWKTKKHRELISDAIYLNGSNEVFQLSFFFLWQETLNLFQISAIITVIVFIILPQRIDSSSTHRKENKPLGIFQSF